MFHSKEGVINVSFKRVRLKLIKELNFIDAEVFSVEHPLFRFLKYFQ